MTLYENENSNKPTAIGYLQYFFCGADLEEHECDACDFTTSRKRLLFKHSQTAHNSEYTKSNKVYENTRNYEGKRKKYAINIISIHSIINIGEFQAINNTVVSTKPLENIFLGCAVSLEKYQCKKCKFTTSLKRLLFLHTQKCQNLGVRSRNIEDFNCYNKNKTDGNHKATKIYLKDNKKYWCEQCDYKTKTMYILNSHILAKHSLKTGTFQCEHCQYKTHMKRNLTMHNLSRHTFARDKYQCEPCNYKTHAKFNIISHIKKQHSLGKKKFQCEHCSYKTYHKQILNDHILGMHPSDPIYKYHCEHCNYKTQAKIKLINHLKIYHLLDKHRFQCDQCHFKTHKKQVLQFHILAKHTINTENYNKCEYCSHKSKNKTLLSAHILEKHPLYAEKFQCKQCDYNTNIKLNLRTHIRLRHLVPLKKGILRCEQCSFITDKNRSLKSHTLRKHPLDSVRYKCDHCDYNTHAKVNLRIHLRSHSLKGKFRCVLCDYKTTKKRVLKTHVLEKHPSITDTIYQCEQCYYKTYVKRDLQKHIKYAHKRNTLNYQCEQCDYKSHNMQYLKTHIKTVHSFTVFQCDKCNYKTQCKSLLKRHIQSRGH